MKTTIPTCAYHRFLQILMPTYINAMSIAMNMIDNAMIIPTPFIKSSFLPKLLPLA